MGQSTERSPLVSMLFWTVQHSLKFLMEIFNILVIIIIYAFLDSPTSLEIFNILVIIITPTPAY